ncbi:hypothetical protein LSCM1_03870 [Leishmania martiniquensis]|uniref:AAA+ ATPase domain-containing protein n=1 Tax=Leishmania martiniquensis TaxID=1580590 RepID=A0A836GCL8_9TRYP|nr:hypothetical protein LSCM1_03870 [Leishmania martiniquensis]
MPVKRPLIPPLRPNSDGTGFLQAGRRGVPARNGSSEPHRTFAPASSSSPSTSSSASSCSLRTAETAVPSRAPVDHFNTGCENGEWRAAALMPPPREERIRTQAEDRRSRHQTSDTKRNTAATVGRSSRVSAAAPAAAAPPLASASPKTKPAKEEAKQSTAPTLSAASFSVTRDHAGVPMGKTCGVASAIVTVGVDGALGPSDCLLPIRLMHRLGLQSGYIVHLSTRYGDVYAEARPIGGRAAASDRVFLNDDAASILVDASSIALCPVLLPQHGVPTLLSVTVEMAIPENARDTGASDSVVPLIASAVELQALFRRALHHKIVYVHLRTTQRLLTHRIALEVVDLSISAEGAELSPSVTKTAATWGIVTDATEVRLSSRSGAKDALSGSPQHAPTTIPNSSIGECQGHVPSGLERMCTLVVGDAGVGKSRWLTRHVSAVRQCERQGDVEESTSSTALARPTRYTEWVQVDQLPQGEGSEVSTATALHEVFERARQSAPATVAVDDLHLICGREASSTGSCWAMSLIAHALAAELLDLQSRCLDVRVVASAPTLKTLDACLTGPTLFGGGVVALEMPTGVQERLVCLRACLSELCVSGAAAGPAISEACLQEVAERAHGFTQRDLRRLVETAVVQAFQARQSITPTEVDLRAASAVVRPSSLKRFEVSVPNVTWADIGGSAEAKQTLCDVVDWCLGKQSWVFKEFDLTPPKGVLLYGPPGCSKTMLAKALANESHMNFISVKGPEVFSKWVGDSEKAVRDIFARARAASPCVVFIDELDGMCGHRGRGGVSDRVISQFLTELDGLPAAFQEKKNALVFVAATNRPDSIDGAVLRPGRIDRRVYVGLPTLPERCAITEIQFKHLPVAVELTASYVAERTEGYTGAEVVAVVKEAALHAVTTNVQASHMTTADIDAALLKVRPRIKAEDVEWYKHWPHHSSSVNAHV